MTHKTMKQRREEFDAGQAKARAEFELKESLLALLPDDCPVPTVSNVKPGGEVQGWLSFSAPAYDPDNEWDAVEVFRILERAGFVLAPASLVKWVGWRASQQYGLSTKEWTHKTYTLERAEPIAPVWVDANTYTGAEARCFMVGPHSEVVRVSVDLPDGCVRLSGQWELNRLGGEIEGRYARGSANIHARATIKDGRKKAGDIFRRRAQVSHDQRALDGDVQWTPAKGQESWTLPASEMVAQIVKGVN